MLLARPRIAHALVILTLVATAAHARQPQVLAPATGAKLRHAAAAREKVSIPDVPLGKPSLDTLELEPMELWAPGAKITIHHGNGTATVDPPRTQYFRGTVKGDRASAVFIAVDDRKMRGMVLSGEKRFAFGTADRTDKAAGKPDDEVIALRELDAEDEPSQGDWKCEVESKPILAGHSLSAIAGDSPKVASHGGGMAGSRYQLRLAIDTDYEFYNVFNNSADATDYLANLVGQASVVFQRDLDTTLNLGDVILYTTQQDPWTVHSQEGATVALAELSKEWHNDPAKAAIARSAVVMVSGRNFSAGRAFQGTLCGGDVSCGTNGSVCGGSEFSNGYGGAYAFCATKGTLLTTVPDPSVTRNGVTYAMPSSNDYWMLYLFTHEVGHLANGPHTNCVQLSAEEKLQYNVTRSFVDECRTGEAVNCFTAAPSYPAEFGTIMSGCQDLADSNGNRASRYLFGEPDRPSSKMLPILRDGLDAATPDGTIHLGTYANPNQDDSQPLACSAGRTAHVTACTDCTYAWSISGGALTGGTTGTSITYTPTTTPVTLTVTIVRPTGCGITANRTISTTCAALPAPGNFVATANATRTSLSWSAVTGAATYEVLRSSDATNYAVVGNTTSLSYLDMSITAGAAYLYRVRGLNSGGNAGASSAPDLAVATTFTDPVLTPHATIIRAIHLIELRMAVNSVRALAGLGAATFSDAELAQIGPKRAHIDELRARLAEALSALGLPAAAYTDPSLASVSMMRVEHVAELRTSLR
jgi:hypothetical protein